MRMAVTTKSAREPSGELLTWDTEFWGIRIGRGGLGALDTWAVDNTIGCLCLLISADDLASAHRSEEAGARLMDVRVKLERETGPVPSVARGFHPQEVSKLAQLARTAFRGLTRFYADPRFFDGRCDDLYETWLRSSCEGWAATVLVVADGDGPVGFVTVHVDGDVSSIGLIAVNGSVRGKGIGTALTSGAVDWAYQQGISRMTVVTQGRNIAAQRTFQRCGFETSEVDLWYHKWLK